MISSRAIDPSLFVQMNNAAAHRGPDDEGCYYDKQKVALGHRRLAIIDLSPLGHQPMAKHDLQITYNGEIYNYKELRDELKTLGHTFKSESDTEVILSAYFQWGPACVDRFNGMWAFAIYNAQTKSLFCSRDRFGVKPFYFYKDANQFIFASEIKQIVKNPQVPRAINAAVVSAYLISSVVDHTSETFFKNIFKLPAGHNLTLQVDTLEYKIEKYYDLRRQNTTSTPQDFPELFESAVRLRLRSDTPVGACLSGGVDSSLIVSLASRMLSGASPLSTFTAVPFDGYRDESSFVRRLEKDLPIKAHYLTPTAEDFSKHLQTVIQLQEEPFLSPSILMQYFVMQKAQQAGLKVLLDGQGADEILLGYEKYFPALLSTLIGKNPLQGFSTLRQVLKNNENVSAGFLMRVFAKQWLTSKLSPQAAMLKKMLPAEYTQDTTYIDINRNAKDVNTDRWMDLEFYNLPGLLRYEDKNSMHFGIETRLPYLDYRVVDVALRWPLEQLIDKGLAKAPLRNHQALPSYISERKSKYNFNAPQSLQLDALLKVDGAAGFLASNKDMSSLSSMQKWKLINLSIWQKTFF